MKSTKSIQQTTMYSLIAAALLLSAAARAQTTVTFQVYVEQELMSEGAEVLVLGSHPALGNWGTRGQLELAPAEDRPNIYTAEAEIEAGQDPVEYKYVLRRDGQNTWERDKLGNRRFWAEGANQVLPVALFDEHAGEGIRQPFLNLQLLLDLSAFYLDEDEIEAVAVMGGRSPLSFDLSNPLLMDKVPQGNRWGATIAFPYGTAKDIPLKFAWKVDGAWEWEWLPGHTVHALLLDDSQGQQWVHMAYNPETRTIQPHARSIATVDNWEAIFAYQGGLADHSKYRYEQAMALMEAGNARGAEVAFAHFETGYAGGDEVNDYYYRKAEHMYNTGDTTAALQILEEKHHSERDPYRKAYYRYRQAEMMVLGGHHQEARKRLLQVERDYPHHQRLVEYARIGRASSLVSEPSDSAAVLEGIALLERMDARGADGRSELAFISARVVQQQLARAHGYMGQAARQKELVRRLANSGTPRQQMQARMELARLEAEDDKEQALSILESIDEQALSRRGKQRLRAEYVELLWEQGYTEEVVKQVGQLRNKWPAHQGLRRLERLEQQARQKIERGEGREKRRARAVQNSTSTQTGGNHR